MFCKPSGTNDAGSSIAFTDDEEPTLANNDFVLRVHTVDGDVGDRLAQGFDDCKVDRQGFTHHSDLSAGSTSSLDPDHSTSTSSSAILASPNLPSPPVVNSSSGSSSSSSSSNSSNLVTPASFDPNPSHSSRPANHSQPPSSQYFGPKHSGHQADPPHTNFNTNSDDTSFNFPFSLDKPVNPYSVTQSPRQLSFIMPSFAQSSTSNPFSLDGPAYAEPMLSSPFLDSHSFFNPQPCLAPSDPPSHLHQLPHHASFPTNLSPLTTSLPDSNFHINTNFPTPNLSNSSSSGVTPPTTCPSAQSDANLDDRTSTIPSPKLHSNSRSPPTDAQCGFSQHFQPRLRNPYSHSGFDLMGALAQVVNRPQPKINVGPVDASAAIVVVDARQNDFPIVFASPSFSELTGYETSEILGQNCRFLQKPFNPCPLKKPTVKPTECPATLQIRSHIQAGREIQSSIINYRKNGQPFINLVTVIPIAWHSSDINFFVGFQADIASLTGKLGIPPSPHPSFSQPPSQLDPSKAIAALFRPKSPKPSLNQLSAISSEEFSPLTTELPPSGLGDVTNLPFHYEAVLSESRDLILAISLKGTLFYVSPSCKSILGYEEEELVNGNISKLCHPGDLTGILRQLKLIGNTPHTPIDLIFRALDRDGNFFWMESQGQLHVEVGKGRKYLVVVGRPREIGPLSWRVIRSVGGLGDNEFWMKLSLDGLCLFATTPVRDVLAFEPSEMVGKSLIQLTSADEHSSIIQSIRSAYEGNDVVTLGHSLKDSNGTSIRVISDFYPPHYSSGPRACGMALPSCKVANPPRFIFCQTNSLCSATQRSQKLLRDGLPALSTLRANAQDAWELVATPEPFKKAFLTNRSSGENLCEHPSASSHGSDMICAKSEDDLFGALGTSKTTPWNYEFSQLKRQNLKLHSEISQKGLTGRLRSSSGNKTHALASKAKSSLAPRAASHAPYHSRNRPHLGHSQETVEPVVDPDPGSLYFDDRAMLRFNPTFGPRDDNSTKTLDDFMS